MYFGRSYEDFTALSFFGMGPSTKYQVSKTRAKRYANHKGGKKFAAGETAKVEADERSGESGGRNKRRKLEKSPDDEDWNGRLEKEEASLIFREIWEKAKNWDGYMRRKDEFLAMQKDWKRDEKRKTGNDRVVHKGPKRNRKTEQTSSV